MKNIYLFLIITCLVFFAKTSYSQSGWQENNYYYEQGTSDVICGNSYAVITGYDFYGRPIYKWYQNCQRRDWYSWYGKRTGYYWTCNGWNCFWDTRYEERTWWYFTWYNFTRPC